MESGSSRNVTKKKARTSNELRQKITFIDPFSPEEHAVSSLWKITRASFARQSRRSQSPKEIRHTMELVGESGWVPLKGICKLVGLCASSTSVMRQTSLFLEDGCEKLARIHCGTNLVQKLIFFFYKRTTEYFLEFIC